MENGDISQSLQVENRMQDFNMIGKNEENIRKIE